jgi:hypothetical protein
MSRQSRQNGFVGYPLLRADIFGFVGYLSALSAGGKYGGIPPFLERWSRQNSRQNAEVRRFAA